MILVDSSVWIDYFRGTATRQADKLDALRALGITARKTINTVIATQCIQSGLTLLYSDKDFDPFVQHLGLRAALPVR